MKIIGIDNFNRESVADVLVAENVPEWAAECMAKALNENFGSQRAPYFYKVVPEDHRLRRGMEDLV